MLGKGTPVERRQRPFSCCGVPLPRRGGERDEKAKLTPQKRERMLDDRDELLAETAVVDLSSAHSSHGRPPFSLCRPFPPEERHRSFPLEPGRFVLLDDMHLGAPARRDDRPVISSTARAYSGYRPSTLARCPLRSARRTSFPYLGPFALPRRRRPGHKLTRTRPSRPRRPRPVRRPPTYVPTGNGREHHRRQRARLLIFLFGATRRMPRYAILAAESVQFCPAKVCNFHRR